MIRRPVLLAALLGVPLQVVAQDASLKSPRLQAVDRAARTVDTLDTTAFWQEMDRAGTPLAEPAPVGDSLLVTFLWRGEPETRNVVIFSGLTGWVPPENVLRRIPRTDIWYRTYTAGPDVRFTYRISVNDNLRHFGEDPDWEARRDAFRLDPRNPRTVPLAGEIVASLFDGPAVEPIFGTDDEQRLSHGRVEAVRVGDHDVNIYAPTGRPGSDLGLAVVLDGAAYTDIVRVPSIVDRLIGAGRLPPLVVALVRHRDRWEDLPPNDRFVEFVADTLLPHLEQRFPVSPDPAARVIVGSSLGGLGAAYLGHRLPDRFGNVIAQSGAYWWAPEDYAESEWLAGHFARTERRPVRFYLDAGTLEDGPVRGGPSMLDLSRHLRDVLCAKGYEVRFRTFSGGHSYVNWRRTLPDALVFALGARPPAPTCAAASGRASVRQERSVHRVHPRE